VYKQLVLCEALDKCSISETIYELIIEPFAKSNQIIICLSYLKNSISAHNVYYLWSSGIL